jgi:hypothetical protein
MPMPQWWGMRPNLMSRPKPKRMWPYARLTTMLSVKLLRPSLGGFWVRVYRSMGANGESPRNESGVLPRTRLSSASMVAWTLTVSVMCRVGSMRRRMLADPKPLRRPQRRWALLEVDAAVEQAAEAVGVGAALVIGATGAVDGLVGDGGRREELVVGRELSL